MSYGIIQAGRRDLEIAENLMRQAVQREYQRNQLNEQIKQKRVFNCRYCLFTPLPMRIFGIDIAKAFPCFFRENLALIKNRAPSSLDVSKRIWIYSTKELRVLEIAAYPVFQRHRANELFHRTISSAFSVFSAFSTKTLSPFERRSSTDL